MNIKNLNCEFVQNMLIHTYIRTSDTKTYVTPV